MLSESYVIQDYRAITKKSICFILPKILFNGSFRFVFLFRLLHFLYKYKFLRVCFFLLYPLYLLSSCIRGIELHPKTNVLGGLQFPHNCGVVINSRASIGRNVVIFNDVTIGSVRSGRHEGVPTIGNSCVICPGAKIMGKCKIGNNCFIGANAVVVKDIPDGSTVVGNPSCIVNRNGKENCSYYTRIEE